MKLTDSMKMGEDQTKTIASIFFLLRFIMLCIAKIYSWFSIQHLSFCKHNNSPMAHRPMYQFVQSRQKGLWTAEEEKEHNLLEA